MEETALFLPPASFLLSAVDEVQPVTVNAFSSPMGRLSSFLLLVLVAGCGLAEYEAKMAEEQERLRYVDEENKWLEGPLRWPEKRETDKDGKGVPPSEIFLRPPRGIALAPDERPIGGLLYRYRGSANPEVSEMFVAVSKEPAPTFAQDVLHSLNAAGAARSNPKE